jgi:hypothetical protein
MEASRLGGLIPNWQGETIEFDMNASVRPKGRLIKRVNMPLDGSTFELEGQTRWSPRL